MARVLVGLALGLVALTATDALASPQTYQEATEAYLATVPAEAKARSDAYFEGGYWMQLWSFLIGVAWAVLLLRQRWSARIRDRAERISQRRNVQVFAYWTMYSLLSAAALLPWTYYSGFVREHEYGLATQTAGAWFGDWAKGQGLAVVLGGLAIMLLYAVFRRAPRRWWLWGAGVSLVLLVIAMALGPVYISPLFNEYTPLADGPVKSAVLQMAHANGVDANEIFMSDASAQSTRISANVAGMLGTERITLNDNLLERCSQAEIEAVMGHELGHYVLNHMYESLVFFGVLAVIAAAFVRWGFAWFVQRHGERCGVRGIDDPAGLPVLGLLLSIFGFLATPVTNSYIRANEAEADIFGLNAARQPDGFATTALKLGEYRKLDPGPIEEVLFFDHPSGRTRIEMAMRFKHR
ncbi:MAG: M48 family metallopeptidase [Myxococcota bacterium]